MNTHNIRAFKKHRTATTEPTALCTWCDCELDPTPRHTCNTCGSFVCCDCDAGAGDPPFDCEECRAK